MPMENTNPNISLTKRIARGRLRGQWQKAFVPAFLITLMTGVPALFSTVSQYTLWMNMILDDSWLDTSDPTQLMEMISRFQLTGPAAMLENLLSLFSFVCGGALAVSLASLALKIIRQEEYSSSEAFIGFRQFAQAFIVSLLIMVFSLLWGLVTILPGVIVFSIGAAIGTPIMIILGTIIFICTIIGYILIILRYSMAYYIASDNPKHPASHVTADSVFFMRRRTGNFFLLELSFIGWLILASIPMSIGVSLMAYGYLDGISSMIFIGAILSFAAMIPLALVSLYISTAEAVYYSTISGNYNLSSADSGQDGYYASPANLNIPANQDVLPADPAEFITSPDQDGFQAGSEEPFHHTGTSDLSAAPDSEISEAGNDPSQASAPPTPAHSDYPEELSAPDPFSNLTEGLNQKDEDE